MKHLTLLFFILISTNLFGQNEGFCIDTIEVKSAILKENRSIIVYKPLKFSSADSVKVLYLIDGEDSNYRYKKIQEQFKDLIPDLMVVGIVNTDRRRDLLYVNGANQFLSFITEELIPVAEKDYKIKNRILFGHSFGGSFTIYAMTKKPAYFNSYIASSPTPIMDLIKREDYLRIDKESNRKLQVLFSYGSSDIEQVREWAQKLTENLSGLSFKNINWRFEIFEGKDHDDSDIPALIKGIELL